VTRPQNWPGFNTLMGCVTDLFGQGSGSLEEEINCENWFCVCSELSNALYTMSSLAVSDCPNSQGVAEATSVLNAFCAQISNTIPPATPTPGSTTGVGGVTRPQNWPGFSTLMGCVTDLFGQGSGSLEEVINCGDWFCVCDDFSNALYTMSSLAVSDCPDSQGVMEATSALNGFCAQISNTIPAATSTPASTTAVGGTTAPVCKTLEAGV